MTAYSSPQGGGHCIRKFDAKTVTIVIAAEFSYDRVRCFECVKDPDSRSPRCQPPLRPSLWQSCPVKPILGSGGGAGSVGISEFRWRRLTPHHRRVMAGLGVVVRVVENAWLPRKGRKCKSRSSLIRFSNLSRMSSRATKGHGDSSMAAPCGGDNGPRRLLG
jgi:hypothetical protein